MYRVWCGALALLACVCGVALPRAARAQQIPPSAYQELRWRMIGPFRGGRTRAAAGVPGQPNVFYIGQVNGGVWKSDDYGRTWMPIFDSQPTQSIGAIAVAPSDPNIIYVASGEGLQRPDLSVGDGIYKSTDAGKTWTHLGLRDGQQIPALAIDPRDPNRVFAAVLGHPYGPNEERGIFRSTDGGANLGESPLQKRKHRRLRHRDRSVESRRALRVAVGGASGPWEDGNDYGGTDGGLFKSTDGGTTWRQLTNGLPKISCKFMPRLRQANRAAFMRSPALQAGGYESGAGLGIYRSDDAGENWTQSPPIRARPCASAAAICRCRESIRRILTSSTARAS